MVYIPNCFSPHHTPGVNDNFKPSGMYIKNYEMEIYNRWRSKVYSTNGKPWDGRYEGEPAPPGTYHYKITIESYQGTTETFKGTVTILP